MLQDLQKSTKFLFTNKEHIKTNVKYRTIIITKNKKGFANVTNCMELAYRKLQADDEGNKKQSK